MPEYEYKCSACGHVFSVRKPISEARSEEPCPACGAETQKVWGAPAVHGSACRVSPSGGFG